MDRTLRMTYATAMVLQALDRGCRHGFDIIDATGLRSTIAVASIVQYN